VVVAWLGPAFRLRRRCSCVVAARDARDGSFQVLAADGRKPVPRMTVRERVGKPIIVASVQDGVKHEALARRQNTIEPAGFVRQRPVGICANERFRQVVPVHASVDRNPEPPDDIGSGSSFEVSEGQQGRHSEVPSAGRSIAPFLVVIYRDAKLIAVPRSFLGDPKLFLFDLPPCCDIEM